MSSIPKCTGCEFLTEEDAGKGRKFFICTMGKWEWCPRPVFDCVPDYVKEPSAPIPSWCKKGLGERR